MREMGLNGPEKDNAQEMEEQDGSSWLTLLGMAVHQPRQADLLHDGEINSYII